MFRHLSVSSQQISDTQLPHQHRMPLQLLLLAMPKPQYKLKIITFKVLELKHREKNVLQQYGHNKIH